MVEVSELGLKLKEEEIELDLGLSIGRNFRKPEDPKQSPDLKPNGFDLDLNEGQHNQALTGIACEQLQERAVMDPKTKRELHALRRQEAKKKRELKRAMRESEPGDQRVSKREKMDHPNARSEFRSVVDLNLSNGQDVGRANGSGLTVPFHASTEQVVGGARSGGSLTAPFPMAQVEYVALNNGLTMQCVVPCWAQSVNEIEKNSVGQNGVACRGFQPYGTELERNAEGDRKAKSNVSSMCSSSVISENRSPSHEGGGSSDSWSHSAQSANRTLLTSSKEDNTTSQTQQSASSYPTTSEITRTSHVVKDLQRNMIRPNPTIPKTTTNHIVKDLQQNIVQPNPSKLGADVENKSPPIYKPFPEENPCNKPLKETKTDARKPPKSPFQSTLLPQMPYVSTTGNGPSGKRVHGFLYRYTKSEVSIVCVCHGSTFSPAEFVQHAGGTDVSQPLRHITVIPSAFG